ncbi:MAG TPA: aspartate/glutamate racemase family protein [Longimicrobium sp.]|nr:aspartate/glutamate racemase family protein [Longimicrobium sp.]
MKSLRGEVLGIVGGLGPLASAEFVRTVYRCATWEREQDAPRVLMDSNPAFPDRTSAFLAGEEHTVSPMLEEVLNSLLERGATQLVICCMTAHHLLPRLPAELRRAIVSVPEVIVGQLRRARGRYLMLCTRGTRYVSLFEREPGWEEVADRVIFPEAADQDLVHDDLIYQIKRMADPASLVPTVRSLLARYEADGFIVGCSEIHLLANVLHGGAEHPECIDPFLTIASNFADAAESARLAAGDRTLSLPGAVVRASAA